MKSTIALTTLCLLPVTIFNVCAAETKEKPEYTMSAELGFLVKSGNTKSGDIKAGFNLKHQLEHWSSSFAINALAKKSEIENDAGQDEYKTTDNKWNIEAQTNYSIEENGKNYLYANIAYQQDKFSSFENQSSLSAGWGRHWLESKTSSFFADIGPGIKKDVLSANGSIQETSETNFILQAQALYTTQINEHVAFKQRFVARQAFESGKNSVYQSETSITSKLIESMQLRFALRIDYDTDVSPKYENTNTQTSLTLVYNF